MNEILRNTIMLLLVPVIGVGLIIGAIWEALATGIDIAREWLNEE